MPMLEEAMLALLAAVGVLALLRAALSPFVRRCAEAVTIVPACGEAAALETSVRALRRDRRLGRVVILDCGMGEDALRVAELLCRDDPCVTICERAALARELTKT